MYINLNELYLDNINTILSNVSINILGHDEQQPLKVTVHSKIRILSFPHLHVVPNLFKFACSEECL